MNLLTEFVKATHGEEVTLVRYGSLLWPSLSDAEPLLDGDIDPINVTERVEVETVSRTLSFGHSQGTYGILSVSHGGKAARWMRLA